MSLDIEENETIANLIINSLKIERREADDWKCENCKNKCSYIKCKRIWKLPEILFISLNRFKDIYNKDNSPIYINECLNFNIGSIETLNKDCKYNIESIGVHYGNLMGGHYTALCNMRDETYNYYNDEIIRKYKKEEVLEDLKMNNSGYLIIYEKENE